MKANQLINRSISITGTCAAVVVLFLAWQVQLKNKDLGAENILLRKAIGEPLTMRDFELDVLPYITAVEPKTAPSPNMSAKLILVGREGCAYCAKQLPIWKEFVSLSVLGKDVDVWLISLGDKPYRGFYDLEQALSAQGRSYREFKVDNVAAFTLATGIRGTPTTLITRENRVQVVYAGLFTDSVRKEMFSGGLLAPRERVRFPPPSFTEAALK